MKSRSTSAASDLPAVSPGPGDCGHATCVSGVSTQRRRETEINVGKVGALAEVKASAEEMKGRYR